MLKEKKFWIGLSLINLTVVALSGLLMRSKIVFSIPAIDYKNLLNAHSHFAFAGWVALALITFFIYDILPDTFGKKRKYQLVLWGIQLSATGMLLSFLFLGYKSVSIFFSTLYIFVTYFFGWIFFKDLKKCTIPPVVKWLSFSAISFLMLSSVGAYVLTYILITKSGNSLLYRDAIYTFLHLQYNGFFSLAVFAIFFSLWSKKGFQLQASASWFSISLIISVLPSLFVALLWHNLSIFYFIGALGCLCIAIGILFFFPVLHASIKKQLFRHPLAKALLLFSFLSFVLKMLLTMGTIYPPLSHAVYGARPVIIGFLHLVFLAFVSFFILALYIHQNYFTLGKKLMVYPFYIFGAGVVANELFLMIQGLEILYKTNSSLYNWLLWGAAILLFIGAVSLAFTFLRIHQQKKPQI